MSAGKGVIAAYREWLPLGTRSPVVTLCEGDTPLIASSALGQRFGVDLHFKFEGLNPTGSFKDRGMTVAVSSALGRGMSSVACASTGNTSASAAAYAARAGMKALVVIPAGRIARGKLAQAMIHRATVIQVDGNFDQALALVREICRRYPVALVNSLNPDRIEGQKTAAFEIVDRLGDAPDCHFLPVGNAGNITAYWKGYREYREAGRSRRLPRMIGFQAEGAAPIVRGAAVERPETIATAIRIGNPAGWSTAVAARDDSGGLIGMVSDREIAEASKILAGEEGIFAEPASAAPLAGFLALAGQGRLERGSRVVLTLTGHGLKDPDFAAGNCVLPEPVPASLEAVAEAAGL